MKTSLSLYLEQCKTEMQKAKYIMDKTIISAKLQGMIMPELENTDERESPGHE